MAKETIYISIVILFMVGLGILGLLIGRSIKDPDDWVAASQSLGIIPLSGTYFATIVSATSIVSYTGYYYLNGWPGMWNFGGITNIIFSSIVGSKKNETIWRYNFSGIYK